MSINRYLYLGPYLECRWSPKTKEVSRKGCPKRECKLYKETTGRGEFCPACGTKVASYKVTVPKEMPGSFELLEAHGLNGDALAVMTWDSDEENVCYLGPNTSHLGREISDYAVVHLDLRGLDREAEMEEFEDRYAKEIKALKTVYATVEVKWGLHQYFN